MASRSLKVEFVPDSSALEITAAPEVHDVSVPDSVTGTPATLENPHVDFPGVWTLISEGEGGVTRYGKAAQVASSGDTVAG